MAESDTEGGGALLARISNEIVRAQKDAWGKGPVQAKSYMFDDMLFVVMHDGMTAAELTMLGFGHHDMVRQFRQTFENEMTAKLTELIEDVTGRKVLTYQSQILFEPHRVVEMFVFDEPGPREARAATADGQVSEGVVGAATTVDLREPPARSAT
jgi:uncharacterized protein YbcI